MSQIQQQEPNSQSSQTQKENKSRRIKKSPKLINKPSEKQEKPEPVSSSMRLTPQYGVFQNQAQKLMRLDKFWRQQIDTFYKAQVSMSQKMMLRNIIRQKVPTLQQILTISTHNISTKKQPYEQLYRYVELLKECRDQHRLVLIEKNDGHFLATYSEVTQQYKVIQISKEEAELIKYRQQAIKILNQRQLEYNKMNNTQIWLSQISTQIAIMLQLMSKNKRAIDYSLERILNRIFEEPERPLSNTNIVQDKYITFLIKKNIKLALQNRQIDFFNYFANLDSYEQYGSFDPEQKQITSQRQFQEYIRKKRAKKAKKNPKGVLKTACAGCLSPHYQLYNPIVHCPECHIRFHKFCYTPNIDGICEPCASRKNLLKQKQTQCYLCPNKGLISVPCRPQFDNGLTIHVFCMLINNMWRVHESNLLYVEKDDQTHIAECMLCKTTSKYVSECRNCQSKAHPLCAYFAGWELERKETQISMNCCFGVQQEELSYQRKYILNYRKMLNKPERQR